MQTLRYSVVSQLSDLERIRGQWKALLAQSSMNEPTLSPAWLLNWWRVFGPLDGRQLRALVIYEGERLVGLVPLLARRHFYRRGIPFRRLEFIGSGESEFDEVCSDYLNVVSERGLEAQVADAFLSALASDLLGDWDELVLSWMDGDQEMTKILSAKLAERGLLVSSMSMGAAPHIPLPNTWDQYVQQLSSSNRYYLNRSVRDFEKWAGGTPTLRRVESAGELEHGKKILLALHAQRFADERPGAFQSPRFSAFHAALMPALLSEGALDLHFIEAHGEPVAALYNIVWNGKIYFYQSGRKLEVPKGVRPGIALHAYAIRRAIGLGLREYDFLNGTSQYKTQLGIARRPIVCLRAAKPSLRETVRSGAEQAIDVARRLRTAFRRRRAAARPKS